MFFEPDPAARYLGGDGQVSVYRVYRANRRTGPLARQDCLDTGTGPVAASIEGYRLHDFCSGGKFTIRLLHPITPVLYEALLFALIGDQFDQADTVVGCVLSVRQTESILSVWVEEEGEGVRSGALK